MHDVHELDLLELVLAQHAAGVLAIRAGLAAKARGVRDELHGQRIGIEDAIGGEIGERHLRGGQQVVVLAVEVEQIGAELGQLTRADQGLGVHQHGRIGLQVAVLARVQIDHELGERAVQPRERSLEHDETAPGELAGESKVHRLAGRAQIHVILGLEFEPGRLAPAALLAVVGLVRALGHALVGQIGNAERDALDFILHTLQARFVRFQLVAQARDLCDQRRDVLTTGLGLADGFRSRVALILQLLGAHLQLLALTLQRRDALGGQIEAAPAQPRRGLVEIPAKKIRVEHRREPSP